MKTLLFIAHSPDFYGADKVLFQVIDAIRDTYHVHVVLPGRGEMANQLAAEFSEVELHYLDLPRFSLSPGDVIANLIGFLPFLKKFKEFLSRIDPDLVYGNTIRSALSVAISRKLGYPTLVHYHECNATGPVGRLLAKLAGGAAKRNIFVCQYALESYAVFAPGIRGNSIVIHNGIAPSDRNPEAQEPPEFHDSSPRFITVGQLAPHKRIGDLLEAMPAILAKHPKATLVVLGEGDLRDTLEKRITELGLENRILLPGYLHDVTPLLNAADVFLAPFEKEACNMAVIEAMMAGKPVVATEGGGMPELVANGETGLLYDPGDITQLTERTLRLAGSIELRQGFGTAAAQRAREHFNLPVQMERVLRQIKTTASQGKEQLP